MLAETLMRMSPRAVKPRFAYGKLWDDQVFVEENTLNVNVARLEKSFKRLVLTMPLRR